MRTWTDRIERYRGRQKLNDNGDDNMSEVTADAEEILKRIDDAFFALDDEWRFTLLNQQAAEVLEVDQDAVVGEVVWDEFEAAVDSTFQREYERAMAEQDPVSFQEYYPPLEAWFEVNAYPSETGLSVYFRDVTERVEREAELERLQDLLESAEQVAGLGGWEIDPETNEVFWTDHLFDLLEVEEGEAPPLEEGLEIYLDEDRQLVEDAVAEALESGEPFDVEARFETSSGEVRWLRIRGTPQNEGGEVETLLGSIQDVTERKEREQQLQQYQRIVETVDDGIYAVDDDGEFLLVNDAFCALTGFDREALLGSPASLLYGDDRKEEVRRLVDEAASDGRSAATIELEITRADGETVPVETRLEPFSTEEGVGRCGVVRDISERIEREAELHDRIEQQEIVAALGQRGLEDRDLDALMADASRLVAATLDVDYCKVLDLDADREELLLRQGVGWNEGIVGSATVSANAEDSQAAYTLSVDEPVVVEDLSTETRFSGPALLTSHDVRSGISTIIGPSDDPWGILGVHDTTAQGFSERDVAFVQSVANVLGTAISRRRDEAQLRDSNERLAALNDINTVVHSLSESVFGLSTKSDIRERICTRLADSDSYEFAWIGDEENGEVVVTAEAGVEGYLADLTLPLDGPPDERGPTAQAHLTDDVQVVQNVQGDPQYEQWQAHAREHGYSASASVPIVANGEQFGTLNVYSSRPSAFDEEERDALERLGSVLAYAFASVERDRELQRERNRLEFMNRLLRHNLLNSLNVVSGNLNLLEGRVDYEVSDQLETATERTRDMIEFVETVRDVTRVIGSNSEQELHPVDIGAVLEERVERARQSYPGAEFNAPDPPAVDVVADDLLGEAIDNILANAVQHNDTESPTVRVDVTTTGEEVTVSVADDGPGIPDEEKRGVFDREATNLEDPDSGFGLYLVSEIIDSYGGSIEVADSDAGGARFDLTFERA